MAFKPIYFLILLIAVLEQVQAATQLRLVNGLLIIEDRHSALSVRSGHDLPEHGYLNRTSSRRLLKDAKAASSASVRNRSVTKILQATPTSSPAVAENSAPEVSFSIENSVTDIQLTTKTPDALTTSAVVIEKKVEQDISATVTKETKDKKDLDKAKETDSSTSFTHTTAVNSVTSPTMDVITIIWYFSTFIALIAFFVVMVCSDKYCGRSTEKPEDSAISAPATPAPSYREFAPPSYDSVMRKYKNRVFIIPMLNESGELKGPGDTTTTTIDIAGTTVTTNAVVSERLTTSVPDSEDNSQRRSNESSESNHPANLEQIVAVEVINEINQGASKRSSSIHSAEESR